MPRVISGSGRFRTRDPTLATMESCATECSPRSRTEITFGKCYTYRDPFVNCLTFQTAASAAVLLLVRLTSLPRLSKRDARVLHFAIRHEPDE
jgi:hypothetical protein